MGGASQDRDDHRAASNDNTVNVSLDFKKDTYAATQSAPAKYWVRSSIRPAPAGKNQIRFSVSEFERPMITHRLGLYHTF